MRIGSYNVENLFARAKAFTIPAAEGSKKVLAAHAELNTLLGEQVYTDKTKARILELLQALDLQRSDDSAYARLRVIRGHLLRRPKNAPVEVVADGRPSWIGWVELTTQQVDELAMRHTAMVIKEVDAHILGVVEADSRPVLKMFSDALLREVDAQPYEQVMLIDGNDDRGIDVGILARPEYPLQRIRTHVFDTDGQGVIFSRDCCEYHFSTPGGNELAVLVNHFKSKGYASPGDPVGAKRRARQAARVAEIYTGLRDGGAEHIAVVGDFNDDPSSAALESLLRQTDLQDISEHAGFDFGERRGTFGGGNEKEKIDYVLLSPALFAKATGGAVFRKGVWHGPRTQHPWEMFPTLTQEVHAASDHAAIYADLDLE